MVSSNLNSNINYIERKTIDPEDVGHDSTYYAIEAFEIPILIVLGKQKYTYSNKDVIYYPIYIVADDKIKAQIGVFESSLKQPLNLIDEDGDIDIEKLGEPLLYSFVNKDFIKKTNTNPTKYLDDDDLAFMKKSDKKVEEMNKTPVENIIDKPSKEEEEKEKKEGEDEEEDDEYDFMRIKVKKDKISEEKQKADDIIEKGIFTIDKHFKQPSFLEEETEADADKYKLDYKESSSNNWIEKFLRNNHYGIIDNEGRGDCFFAVIRDAFEHIGQKTTVSKLRALLASQLTDSVYQENRNLYNNFEMEKQTIKKNLIELKKTNDIYAQRIKKIKDKKEVEKIIEETKSIKEQYKKKMVEMKEVERLQDDYIGFMKDIDTLEKYRTYITTSQFWADTWAISTLESLLKFKVIILAEESYKERSFDNVLNCGEMNKNLINNESKEIKRFEPNFYVITTYSGSHYRLVTYKKKHIFTFPEIPYDMKVLIVNKCLEKNAGIFYLIQDFRDFKTKLGLDPDEGNPEKEGEEEDEDENSYLFNKSTVFVLHPKSLDAKPGKGSNEKIDNENRNKFVTLSKNKHWRRKLDDMWVEAPFSLDNKRWLSVEHYLQGSKFKKGFPDFYAMFSIDQPSELSKDPEVAKMVGDLTKTKHKEMRPKNVKIDVDYSLGRERIERETALRAKFEGNEDLKQILKSTQDALLKRAIRRKPAEPDVLLMKVRHETK
jgi:predicted NAD-dependent protein-ADP-ribosyltransferase YbiA (DUF1768 family)